MAGSRIQKNKAHKTRFASKSSRHAHKLAADGKGISKGTQVHISKGARAARLQRSKMVRDQKRAALLSEKRAMSGPTSPPRILVLFALSSNVQLTKLKQRLLEALASDESSKLYDLVDNMQTDEVLGGRESEMFNIVSSIRCKLRCTVADIIAFVASTEASSEGGLHNSYIDPVGNQCLSMFRAQGLPSTVGLIIDLPIDSKKKQESKKACISSLSAEFPEDCKILSADTVEDCHKLLRHFSEQRLSAPQWRNQRSFVMAQQTWPTEEEIAEAARNNKQKKLKKKVLPRGMSDYQAAWIADETDDEYETDDGNGPVDGMVLDREEQRDGDHEGSALFGEASLAIDQISVSFTSKDYDEETQTDMMAEDENLTQEEMQAEIQRLKAAHAQDEEFPDEVDTPMDVPARQRFAKYRGLKSFRTSTWDPKESLPQEYARIFAFDNFARIHKHVLAKAKDVDNGSVDGCVNVGAYVRLHIKGVPLDVATNIRKHDSYTDPIKSKESLVFHAGFRQFSARPIFSSDDLNVDKHKLERFLHPGRFTVASIFAPICFSPLPLVVFKDNNMEAIGHKIAAFGSLRSVDPDRIILKKVILTGYPQRVSKVKAIVRFMFHNPEDVRWFKPVELWTKYGRRGRIREPVGTHEDQKIMLKICLEKWLFENV